MLKCIKLADIFGVIKKKKKIRKNQKKKSNIVQVSDNQLILGENFALLKAWGVNQQQ